MTPDQGVEFILRITFKIIFSLSASHAHLIDFTCFAVPSRVSLGASTHKSRHYIGTASPILTGGGRTVVDDGLYYSQESRKTDIDI